MISRAPVTFVVGVIIIAGATWAGATIFFKQEVAAAGKEHDALVAQRDLYKERLDLTVRAAPANDGEPLAGRSPPKTKTAFVVAAREPKVVRTIAPVPVPTGSTGADVVQSVNQSGGITAHTVNLGLQPRVLLDADKQLMLAKIPRDKPIGVTAVLGDTEALALAGDIYAFLKTSGFNMEEDGVSQSIFTTPIKGVIVSLEPSKTRVIVGFNGPRG